MASAKKPLVKLPSPPSNISKSALKKVAKEIAQKGSKKMGK